MLYPKNNKMKKIIYTLVLITTTLSCSETVINQESTLLPLTETGGGEVLCQDLFYPIEIIPLKETTEFHIRDIKKIENFNDEYYVLCNNSKNVLAVFSSSGNKIREIGRWGNGHGEYGQIYDFCIDKKNQRIMILCANSLVKMYSLQGEYLTEKVISKSALWNIATIDGNILCTSNHQTFTNGEDAFLFYIFDENLNLITKHTNVLSDYMGMFPLLTSLLKTAGNHYIYSDFYMHRIYILDKMGEVTQIYNYDKKALMPSTLFKEYNLFTENQFKYDFILDNIVITDTILSIYKVGQQVRIALNHRNGETIMNGPIKGPIPKLYTTDGNNLISLSTVEDLGKMSFINYDEKDESFFYVVRYKMNDLK